VEQVVNVQQFDDVKTFYQRVEPYLMKDEAAHNLILGICSTLMLENPYQYPPYLACCEHKGRSRRCCAADATTQFNPL
jgi:uncharacterized protein